MVTADLALLRCGFLAALVSPIAVALLTEGVAVGFTLTDFIVSQYLQGRFQMDPFTLETKLTLRGSWPRSRC